MLASILFQKKQYFKYVANTQKSNEVQHVDRFRRLVRLIPSLTDLELTMNFALVFASLMAAAVYGEICRDKADCADTKCVTGMITCAEISGNHLCTCIHNNMNNITCSARADCQMDSVSMNCANDMRHCYDGTCRCEGMGHNHGMHTQHPHPDHPTHPPHGGH
ncbi:uncharacterized protein LOC132563434 [Ylistrum balloti]|uniref:uncharacterized protein LOC132563434 n=1 Tax=Ylistrum balloti TaxID=509963 RepID=UPI002905A528|nr:uncharacterized protein LOC132563434 [Ylistrum balloti]